MKTDRQNLERRAADPFLDRRSGEDRRLAYDLDYFARGGLERRKQGERRVAGERRGQCVKISDWSSVCPPDEDPSR